MTVYIEASVPLADIAKATRRTAAELEAEAVEYNFFVGVDWAGRPAVAEQDAQELVTGEHRRRREHDVAWRRHLSDCAAWETARDDAVRAAHENALGGRQGGEAHAAAREAAIEAGRAFEVRTPVPLWQGTDTGNAVRKYTERPPEGLLKRTVARVKAGAR